jgi:signal transduction histidine kinase
LRRAVFSLKTTRTALGLYGTLLVLPTLVLGWLHWRALEKEYEAELASVPELAQDGVRRIAGAMRDRLEKIVEAESVRPFTDYSEFVFPEESFGDEITAQRSPMVRRQLPVGILAWFTFDRKAGPDGQIEVLVGDDTFGREGVAENFIPIIQDYRQRKGEDHLLTRVTELEGTPQAFPLRSVALHLRNDDLECVESCSEQMVDRVISASVSEFRLQFYVDDEDKPRAIASRRIIATGPLEDLPPGAECLYPLTKGFGIQQGFLIDVNWLFKDLPLELEAQVLDANASLRKPDPAGPIDRIDTVFASLFPVQVLGFETFDDADSTYSKLEVEIDTDDLRARFQKQARNLLVVGLMLVLTLATGMTLLYRSVRRELEHAHRMQNFVAAVTHELRTPLSTIRLHGEMLLDGWASDPAKQQEYYGRIVRETDRLSTLVENVLEKSRLKETVTTPVTGNLNEIVENLRTDFENGDSPDLTFELAPRLPDVWMTPEAIAGILSNLIENARKYATVPAGGEPILVSTRWDGEQALLEVSDRGPGVPAEEKEHVFEAFYRVGSEATRTNTGTGLGLHLVRLHAESAGARVSIHDREGGGSIFRVAWRTAG